MDTSTCTTREQANASLPAHVEHELARLGVVQPCKPDTAPQEYTVPWKPTHPGEDPPF